MAKSKSRFEQVMTALGGDLSNEKLKDILWTKKGTPRKHYTKAQYEAVFEEIFWEFSKERERQGIARTIIDNFRDMSKWIHADKGGFLEKEVNDFCDKIISSNPQGEEILAMALEDADNDGAIEEMRVWSYRYNVRQNLDSLLKYVRKAADRMGETLNGDMMSEAEKLARDYDDRIAQDEEVEDLDYIDI